LENLWCSKLYFSHPSLVVAIAAALPSPAILSSAVRPPAMFLPISNVACSIEPLFSAICYLLINNHPVPRRPYVLALATSIVREDCGQATQPCLCPSMWITCTAANDLYFYLASGWISCVSIGFIACQRLRETS
jgi:hypothetical protein